MLFTLHFFRQYLLCISLDRQIKNSDSLFNKKAGPSCQPDEQPATIPTPVEADIPDPWFDEPGQVGGAGGGALGFWELWNLLNNPNSALSP